MSNAESPWTRYDPKQERPLAGYGVLIGTYLTAVATTTLLLRRSGVRLPAKVAQADLALLGVATFRATRLVTKDSITSAVRAPFTTFEGSGGEGEVNEVVVGEGLRHAVGELITCPFCMTVWMSTAAMVGLAIAPKPTRWIASVLNVAAASDFLQFLYAAARRAAGE